MRDEDRMRRFGGPGWPIRPAVSHPEPFGRFGVLARSRGAVSWYVGAAFSLIWLFSIVPAITDSHTALTLAGLAALTLFVALFVLGGPLIWSLPGRWRLLPAGLLFALSFALAPWLGWGVGSTWPYVGVLIGLAVVPWSRTWLLIVALAVLDWVLRALPAGFDDTNMLWSPALVLSVSSSMAAFVRNVAAMNELRAAQDQVAALAAERERGRLARDLHDILGHSLTVITVKAELAGRLIDIDPARAATEIDEVEQLARGALADVRATVNAARSVSIAGEIASASRALSAAGIADELPTATDAVPAERRELAGWVVREGITNVVRHSGASRCRVRLTPTSVEVADDGRGPGGASGGGLTGLRDRVEASGARLALGRAPEGGFLVRVTW